MRAEIRAFEWTDAEREIEEGKEVNLPTLLVLHVGEQGGLGANLFQLEVTTPDAFRGVVERAGVMPGRHFLFVDDFNRSRVEAFVAKWVSQWQGETWDELALKIGRLGLWEFEDYRETT